MNTDEHRYTTPVIPAQAGIYRDMAVTQVLALAWVLMRAASVGLQ
jgi:hypothetical protein